MRRTAFSWLEFTTGVEILLVVILLIAGLSFTFFVSCVWSGASLRYAAFGRLLWLPGASVVAAWILYRFKADKLAIVCTLVPIPNFVILFLNWPRPGASCVGMSQPECSH